MSQLYAISLEFNDRYDSRVSSDLSQDRNSDVAYKARIQRLLDAQSDRLDSYLVNRFGNTPISIDVTNLSGSLSANSTTLTVTDGSKVYNNEYVILYQDGTNPSEKVLIQSISGNTVTLSPLTPTVYAHTNNTQIKTIPGPLTDWVCTKTAQRLFFRRNSEPTGIDLDVKDADMWLSEILSYRITLPGVNRVGPSVLTSQNQQYKFIPGLTPFITGVSGCTLPNQNQ